MFVAIDAPGGTATLSITGGRFFRFTGGSLVGGTITVTGDAESSTKIKVTGMRHVTIQYDHSYDDSGEITLACTNGATAWGTSNPDHTQGQIHCGQGQSVRLEAWILN